MNIHDRALAVDRILAEPIFLETTEAIRRDALEELLHADATDADTIRDAQALVRAIDALVGKLRSTVTAAKFSKQPVNR